VSDYRAPLQEQLFALDAVAAFSTTPPGRETVTPALADAILSESARLAEGRFAPLNRIGDVEGARWDGGEVRLPEGFSAAYRSYVEGGWNGLGAHPDHGGQGLPFALAVAVQEQFTSANMALSLCPMLNQGAIEALHAHGSAELKSLYLPKLVGGEWTGTMNLTEPQAGSDVGALRTMASRADNGTYRIKGSKIFISWGEHGIAENIVHLVLARLPDAPAGTRGISLFVVPKFIPDTDGRPGVRNDLRCVSIEHKLGIHASPTCTMIFGDADACVGWLVGEEHGGMRAMFTMMNHARINVGLQGVAIAERAYQGALAYARERIQSARIGTREPARIIEHPDVRRMLMTMRANTQAIRAITYFNAAAVDRAHAATDSRERCRLQRRADLLTPITKAFATDTGAEVASLGIQVFGGMGYIEETGAAQHLRDARIAQIYEGTNGIQALDLVRRKLFANDGEAVQDLLAESTALLADLSSEHALQSLGATLGAALESLRMATDGISAMRPEQAAAGAAPYLQMFGLGLGGFLLARQAKEALTRLQRGDRESSFLSAKIATAQFYHQQIMCRATSLTESVLYGAEITLALTDEQFAQ